MAGLTMRTLALVLALLAVALVHNMAEGSSQVERDCLLGDMNINQQPRSDGSFIVAVNNACFNPLCQPRNVHVSCANYAPTWSVPSQDDFYRIPNTDTCVVNNNQPIADFTAFTYSQDTMATLTVINAEFVCG